jgi:hypothetical protein
VVRTFDQLGQGGLHALDIGQALGLVLCNDLQSLVKGLVDAQSRGLVGGLGGVPDNRLDRECASRLILIWLNRYNRSVPEVLVPDYKSPL